jgi:transposase
MEPRRQLTDRQWEKLKPIIEAQRGVGRRGRNDRNFVEAVFWIHRTGAPWRDLPSDFGSWKTVYNRFDRWSSNGRWAEIFEALQDDVDSEWHSLDSTINRAHQHAAGGNGGAEAQAIGRSRGGRSTKVHLIVDALGLPIAFEITVGERHDNQPAPVLIDRVQPRQLLADKAYDSQTIRAQLAALGCVAVIPSTKRRKEAIPHDRERYKARSAVECTFNLFKQARRFATRYEKTLRNYTAMVLLCCIRCWLRV